jgi:TetR/AcrR family transcriptional repressor of nem operon
MARPKEFDTNAVVQDAMEAFWKRGYAATSVSDLLEETGLNRGSLYGSFGDKHRLFICALDRYDEQVWAKIREAMDQPGPARRVIEQWMRNYAESCTGTEGRQGCLLCKAAMELVPHDPEVAAWMQRIGRRNERYLARLVERGQREGDIPTSLDARALSRFLWNALAGLRLMGATSPTRRAVRETIELVLQVLDSQGAK